MSDGISVFLFTYFSVVIVIHELLTAIIPTSLVYAVIQLLMEILPVEYIKAYTMVEIPILSKYGTKKPKEH